MKKYKTIIADPPWKYGNSFKNCDTDYGQIHLHYPDMGICDIAALPVGEYADTDCVLLLWVTFPMLKDAFYILASWKFKYVTGFPWIKAKDVSTDLWGKLKFRIRYGIGYWVAGCSELVLISRRGNPRLPNRDFCGLLSPNVTHSKKPNSLYEYAESLEGPYLELFARKERPGWDSFGNEIENSIALSN